MNELLVNKKCLVTGASRGIGKSIVKKLLNSGATVVSTASCKENLDELKKEFLSFSEKLFLIPADLNSSKEVQNLCKQVTECVGDIDILINNAGILHLQKLDTSEEILRKSFEVNYFLLLHYVNTFLNQ